jgi:hypothetical protein
MINKIKIKLNRLFCKHKKVEYKERISRYHPLHGERIYTFCEDCGKMLGSRFYTNEELCMSFEEYRGDNWKKHILNRIIEKGEGHD